MNVAKFSTGVCLLVLSSCTAGLDIEGEGESSNTSGEQSGETFASEFSCQAVSWCTNWQPERLGVLADDLPQSPSGILNDGIYRLEEGGFSALTYLFKGNEYIEISPNYNNVSGTFSLSGNQIMLRANRTCSDGGEFDLQSDQQKDFVANGDEFYFLGSCEAECTPNQKFVRVDNLCSASDNFRCLGDDCVCDVQEESIPTSTSDLGCGTL